MRCSDHAGRRTLAQYVVYDSSECKLSGISEFTIVDIFLDLERVVATQPTLLLSLAASTTDWALV